MSRFAKAAVLGGFLAIAMLVPAVRAQDTDGDASSQLPEQPKPAAKPNKFPALNPCAYSAPEAPPFVAPKIDIEPEPSLVALRLWPFDEQEREGRRAGSEIHVYTNEVIAPVTVLDKRGQFVLDLEQKDFRVFDNGVEQKIDHWDVGGDSLAVTLLLETSSHLEMMAPVIQSLGSIFGETVMALNGEAAVLTYDATVDLRQNFTRDHDAVERAVADVQFEAPELHLYDAMAAAVDLLKTQPENLRRVMVIVGESQDTGSAAKLGLAARSGAGEHCDLCGGAQQQLGGSSIWRARAAHAAGNIGADDDSRAGAKPDWAQFLRLDGAGDVGGHARNKRNQESSIGSGRGGDGRRALSRVARSDDAGCVGPDRRRVAFTVHRELYAGRGGRGISRD
jgi:hypothetical protein